MVPGWCTLASAERARNYRTPFAAERALRKDLQQRPVVAQREADAARRAAGDLQNKLTKALAERDETRRQLAAAKPEGNPKQG